MDIVIRYVFKHRFSGNIEIKEYSTSQLEARAAKKLSPCFDETEYEMIARNLFTGLKDKNGVEIYEGDIWVTGDKKVKVEFDQERAGFFPFATSDGCGCCDDETYDPNNGEVIGNIYQNPDLLEEAR